MNISKKKEKEILSSYAAGHTGPERIGRWVDEGEKFLGSQISVQNQGY